VISEKALKAAYKDGIERAEAGLSGPPSEDAINFVLYIAFLSGYTIEKQRQAEEKRINDLMAAHNRGQADAKAGLEKDFSGCASPDAHMAYIAGYYSE